jgi:hypothetical protein
VASSLPGFCDGLEKGLRPFVEAFPLAGLLQGPHLKAQGPVRTTGKDQALGWLPSNLLLRLRSELEAPALL